MKRLLSIALLFFAPLCGAEEFTVRLSAQRAQLANYCNNAYTTCDHLGSGLGVGLLFPKVEVGRVHTRAFVSFVDISGWTSSAELAAPAGYSSLQRVSFTSICVGAQIDLLQGPIVPFIGLGVSYARFDVLDTVERTAVSLRRRDYQVRGDVDLGLSVSISHATRIVVSHRISNHKFGRGVTLKDQNQAGLSVDF